MSPLPLLAETQESSTAWYKMLRGLDELTGVTLMNWVVVAAIAVTIFVATWLLQLLIRRVARGTDESTSWVGGFVRHLLKKTRLVVILFIALYVASLALEPTPAWEEFYERIRLFLYGLAVISLLLQIGIWGNASVNFFAERAREAQVDRSKHTTILALGILSKIILWAMILLLVLSNLGIDVTALIAGLGIGGIAIALATQKMLGDLFASMVMMFDRPFDLGDFIMVDDKMGTVEKIGLKTTKLRALSGEQLIFSNSDLLDSRIQNYRRMTQRRISFEFGVVYGTPSEKLERIPEWVKELVEATPQTTFDRAHFFRFGDYAKIFVVVYYVDSPEFLAYMNAQQTINFGLARKLEAESVEMAFPTQTLYLHKAEALAGPGDKV